MEHHSQICSSLKDDGQSSPCVGPLEAVSNGGFSLTVIRHDRCRPRVPWWGRWAGLCMAWIFATSARCLPGRAAWALPLAVFALALALRALEYIISAIAFGLTLPWRGQTIKGGFHWSYDGYDVGIWISTFVLALLVAWLGWVGRRWGALRFELACGATFGLLLAGQFLLARPLLDLPRLSSAVQLQVLLITLAAALLGGVIGALQGDWLARFRR